VRGLAKKLGVTKPVVTRALNAMGKQAIITRRRDEADKRNVIVQRTVKGALHVEAMGEMVAGLAKKTLV
jgi:DNA-binding MarR family transcriptional regulator